MQDVSNIISLFADDMPCASGSSQVSGKTKQKTIDAHGPDRSPLVLPLESDSGPITVSTVPQSRVDRETMVEIEERLYRHPAVAQATAFRYESGNGNIGYGAAVVLFDWIENVTAADIKKWVAAHLDSVALPIEIVKVEPGLFTK